MPKLSEIFRRPDIPLDVAQRVLQEATAASGAWDVILTPIEKSPSEPPVDYEVSYVQRTKGSTAIVPLDAKEHSSFYKQMSNDARSFLQRNDALAQRMSGAEYSDLYFNKRHLNRRVEDTNGNGRVDNGDRFYARTKAKKAKKKGKGRWAWKRLRSKKKIRKLIAATKTALQEEVNAPKYSNTEIPYEERAKRFAGARASTRAEMNCVPISYFKNLFGKDIQVTDANGNGVVDGADIFVSKTTGKTLPSQGEQVMKGLEIAASMLLYRRINGLPIPPASSAVS